MTRDKHDARILLDYIRKKHELSLTIESLEMEDPQKQQIIEVEGRFFLVPPAIASVVELVKSGASLKQCLKPLRDKTPPNLTDVKLLGLLRLVLGKHNIALKVVHGDCVDYICLSSSRGFSEPPKKNKYLLVSHILLSKSSVAKLTKPFAGLLTLPALALFVCTIVALLVIGTLGGGVINPLDFGLVTGVPGEAHAMPAYFVPVTLAIIVLCFLFHELGHSSAALKFGAGVRGIGMGIYWIFPVLYSDVTTVWRLAPRKRFIVDVAGIYFQCIAILVMEVILLTPVNATIREILAICIAYNSLIIITNLNPVLRYDGYWMFSDFFDIPNLRENANDYIYQLITGIFGKSPRKKPDRNVALTIYAVLAFVASIGFMIYLLIAVWKGYAQWPSMVHQLQAVYPNLIMHNYTATFHAMLLSLKFVVPIVLFPVLIVLSLWATIRTFLIPVIHASVGNGMGYGVNGKSRPSRSTF